MRMRAKTNVLLPACAFASFWKNEENSATDEKQTGVFEASFPFFDCGIGCDASTRAMILHQAAYFKL